MFAIRSIAVLLLVLAARPVMAAPAPAAAKPKADPAVAVLLDQLGYRYEIDEDGDYKMTMSVDDDRRTQLVFVRSPVESYGRYRVREIWSPAYRSPTAAFPGPVANRLLEASHDLKLGAWVKQGGHALMVVKIDADADAEALEDAITAAVTSADEMEKELAGDPGSDEL
ncbi:hypothetical protein [Pseudoxanthomonas sp. 10H]|uniref:hypothetical protein n=1 Tax=Pseudoxanthomonas sp. 10H TaxID=3242729 RepID=UPI003557B969